MEIADYYWSGDDREWSLDLLHWSGGDMEPDTETCTDKHYVFTERLNWAFCCSCSKLASNLPADGEPWYPILRRGRTNCE